MEAIKRNSKSRIGGGGAKGPYPALFGHFASSFLFARRGLLAAVDGRNCAKGLVSKQIAHVGSVTMNGSKWDWFSVVGTEKGIARAFSIMSLREIRSDVLHGAFVERSPL
jgi:hypothetical protein